MLKALRKIVNETSILMSSSLVVVVIREWRVVVSLLQFHLSSLSKPPKNGAADVLRGFQTL